MTLLICWCSASTSGGEEFSYQDAFFARLATPMTSVQDGKPFRDAIASVMAPVQLNWWLDRGVDPSAPISLGPVGPTVATAVEKIAATRECVVMPVSNVVLIGRRKWVEATAASLISPRSQTPTTRSERAAQKVSVAWNALTTPQEAIALASDQGSVEVSPELPHDLWPAVEWSGIERSVAITLVLAQFDRKPADAGSENRISTVPADSSGTFTRRYLAGPATASVRKAIEQIHPSARIRLRDGWLDVTAKMSAHQAAGNAMLAAQAAGVAQQMNAEDRTFTLKPTRAPAGSLLTSFAKAANRNCLIQDSAREACQQMITMEAENQTLRELIDRVAKQIGVRVTWHADRIVVDSAAQ